jgi:hypothetical protein
MELFARPPGLQACNRHGKEAINMTKYAVAVLLGSAMSAVVIGLAAPAAAASGGSGDTRNTTIDSLGYTVGSDKLGAIDTIQRD